METTNKLIIKFCSSCKAGEIFDVPAVYKVTGYYIQENRPYRASLCEDHAEMMHDYLSKIRMRLIRNIPTN